jgi:hypothetical protein
MQARPFVLRMQDRLVFHTPDSREYNIMHDELKDSASLLFSFSSAVCDGNEDIQYYYYN